MAISPVTIFETSVSATALTDLQEHVKLLPEVITNKKEFDLIYENYQNVRRLRIALDKDSKAKVKHAKTTFTNIKDAIQGEETRILSILKPIETKLSNCREAWETKQKEIADLKAIETAAAQEREFIRQEKIRTQQYIDDNWELACEMNASHDQKILDDIARVKKDEELKAREEELEAREKELELQEQERVELEQREIRIMDLSKDRVPFNTAWIEGHFEKERIQQSEQGLIDFERNKNRLSYDQAWNEAHADPISDISKLSEEIKTAEPATFEEMEKEENDPEKETLQNIHKEFSEFRSVFTKKHLIDECHVANMSDDKADILAVFFNSIQEAENSFLNSIN